MRSPIDYMLQRVDGFKITDLARRVVPCYKNIEQADGSTELRLCLLVDHYNLYRFPYEDESTTSGMVRGMPGLEIKARYVRGEMEHLRLREFQPGFCRPVDPERYRDGWAQK